MSGVTLIHGGHPVGFKRGCAECIAAKHDQQAKARREKREAEPKAVAAKRVQRTKARRLQRDTAPFREHYQKVADVVATVTPITPNADRPKRRSAAPTFGRNVEAFERQCELHPGVVESRPAEAEACRTMAMQLDNELLVTHMSQIAKVYSTMLTDLFAGKKKKSNAGRLAIVNAMSGPRRRAAQ
jgi:hypothetical protein